MQVELVLDGDEAAAESTHHLILHTRPLKGERVTAGAGRHAAGYAATGAVWRHRQGIDQRHIGIDSAVPSVAVARRVHGRRFATQRPRAGLGRLFQVGLMSQWLDVTHGGPECENVVVDGVPLCGGTLFGHGIVTRARSPIRGTV